MVRGRKQAPTNEFIQEFNINKEQRLQELSADYQRKSREINTSHD